MKKVSTLSSFSTRMLMVGCLLSGSFALTGGADALTLTVTKEGAGGKPGTASSIAVQSIHIKGIPGLAELTIPGALADQFVDLRAKAKNSVGQDFATLLLTNPAYTVTVVGADNKLYTPKFNLNASPAATASEWVTLTPR